MDKEKYLNLLGLTNVAEYVNKKLRTVTEMPPASPNDIVLYKGDTSADYICGCIYLAEESGKFFAWTDFNNIYYTKSLSPAIGDIAYSDTQGTESGYTVEEYDSENLIVTINSVAYERIQTEDEKIYSWVIKSGIKNIKFGYLNSEDGFFYEDKLYTKEFEKNAEYVYIDIEENFIYRYDKTENKYILIGGTDFQVGEMPEPAENLVNKIYQYIGDSTEEYKHGYFYECLEVVPETEPKTYEWINLKVQEADSIVWVDSISSIDKIEDSIYGITTNASLENRFEKYFKEVSDSSENLDNATYDKWEPYSDTDIWLVLKENSAKKVSYVLRQDDYYVALARKFFVKTVDDTLYGPFENDTEFPLYMKDFIYYGGNEELQSLDLIGENVVYHGYYNSSTDLFYEDSNFQNPIENNGQYIYSDILTNLLYRYERNPAPEWYAWGNYDSADMTVLYYTKDNPENMTTETILYNTSFEDVSENFSISIVTSQYMIKIKNNSDETTSYAYRYPARSHLDILKKHFVSYSYELEFLTAKDIDTLMQSVSYNQWSYLAQIIVDTEVSTKKVWSSNKIQALLNTTLDSAKSYTNEQLAHFSSTTYKIVDSVDEVVSRNYMYLIPIAGSTDSYDIYVLIDDTPTHIGTTQTDLSQYYTKTEADERYLKIVDAASTYLTKAKYDAEVGDITNLDESFTATDIIGALNELKSLIQKASFSNDDDLIIGG